MRRIFQKKRFLLKVFSILTSILIWMYVVSSAELTTSKFIEVHVETPKGMSVKNILKTKVEYIVKGPGLFVRKFIDTEHKITIKSKKYYNKKRKTFKLNLEKFQTKLPLGVTLVAMEPRSMEVQLEKTLQKKLPISVDGEENLPVNGKISFSPSSVMVSGPKSIVSNMKIFNLGALPTFDMTKEFSGNIPVKNIDNRVSYDQILINFQYRIETKVIEFEFAQLPIIFQSVKMINRTSPKTVSILVRGEENFIKSMDSSIVSVIATIPNKKGKKHEIQLTAELPDGVELLKIKPETVTVFME